MPETKKRKGKAKEVKGSKQQNGQVGAPSMFTPATQQRILQLIKAGNYADTAAAACGVHRMSFNRWRADGEKIRGFIATGQMVNPTAIEKELVSFCAAIEEAEGQAESRSIMLIGKAGETDWRAEAWRVARRSSNRWGERQSIEHTGPEGGPIQVSLADTISKLYETAAKLESKDDE